MKRKSNEQLAEGPYLASRIAPRNQAFLALNMDLFQYSCSLLSVSERQQNTAD